jgi:hypothetical protein
MIKREVSKTAVISKLLKKIDLIINTNQESFKELLDEETGDIIIHGTGPLNKESAEPKINSILEVIKQKSIDKYIKIVNHKKVSIYYKILDVQPDYYPVGCSIVFYCNKVNKNLTLDKTIKKFTLSCTPHTFITEKDLIHRFKKKWTVDYSVIDKQLYILRNEVGRIKIGQAIDVSKRIKCILAQSGIYIDIIRFVEKGAIYEKHFLSLFKDKKFHGEWFNLTDEEIEFLLKTNFEEYFKK